MDSHNLSLLEGARGLRRERLPGSFGQAQLAAGGSNQGGVVRNMCETCGAGSEFFLGKINFLLDSTPQKSANAVCTLTKKEFYRYKISNQGFSRHGCPRGNLRPIFAQPSPARQLRAGSPKMVSAI